MIKTKKLSAFFAIICFALLGNPAKSQELDFATMDLVPYALRDDSSGRPGLIVEINKMIAEQANVSITDEILPIARALKNLEHGVTDCAVIALTPWSEENFIPIAEVLDKFDGTVVTRAGLPISKIEDLHGQRLAIPRGSFRKFPISTDPKIERVLTTGYEQSVRLLKAGRVDAIAGSEISLFFYLHSEEMDQQDIGGILPFLQSSLWLHCAKGQVSPEARERLKQSTNSLRDRGIFKRLLKSYIPEDFS
ncbi:substrate-binding periplasmic protein [Parasedimentitalea huanghaiensis]|nr:transporter substrate-binding domain-containing protein [Zongyanglinia huanghaiensis]